VLKEVKMVSILSVISADQTIPPLRAKNEKSLNADQFPALRSEEFDSDR
jgi:hypothetical protein